MKTSLPQSASRAAIGTLDEAYASLRGDIRAKPGGASLCTRCTAARICSRQVPLGG